MSNSGLLWFRTGGEEAADGESCNLRRVGGWLRYCVFGKIIDGNCFWLAGLIGVFRHWVRVFCVDLCVWVKAVGFDMETRGCRSFHRSKLGSIAFVKRWKLEVFWVNLVGVVGL